MTPDDLRALGHALNADDQANNELILLLDAADRIEEHERWKAEVLAYIEHLEDALESIVASGAYPEAAIAGEALAATHRGKVSESSGGDLEPDR